MASEDTPTIVFLSGSKLHLLAGAAEPTVFESRFGQEIRDRAAQLQHKHSWKTKGRGAQFMSGGLLWGMDQSDPSRIRIAMKGLCRGREPGQVLYSLDTSEVGGVFAVDTGSGEERRLFHGAGDHVEHLGASPGSTRIACALHREGVANLAVMNVDGSELTEVTEGDSLDLAPSWIPGEQDKLVYQSAGVGRDSAGVPVGLGPFGIHGLDLKQGTVTDLAGDGAHDLLGPRMDAGGGLYYIRRPYRSPSTRGSVLRALLDFLLFPFRLLFALFQWLNIFTARNTGRPLTTAGGPRREGADMRQLMIWGNLIDADEATRHKTGDDVPALVPSTWQLVRQAGADASPEVLARGVLSFDLCDDGRIVYTNGAAIYLLDRDGGRTRVHRAERIEQVAVLGDG
jgi:hypothetical protein